MHMTLEFGTKAETLEMLRSLDFNISPLYYFSLSDWNENYVAVIEAANRNFLGGPTCQCA